jgi:hypothetical protein
MNTDNESLNPYAASTTTDVATSSVAWHRDFQLVGKKLRCHSGLQLPDYCLVTGHSNDVVPLPLSIYASGKSVRHYRFWGIGLMLSVPLVVIFAIAVGGPAPAESSVAVIVTIISALLILGLVLFLLGGRHGQHLVLQAVVDRNRLMWGRRLGVIPSWALVLVLVLRVGGFVSSDSILLPLVFFSIGGQWGARWIFSRGTQLRAVVDEQGVFEISGFSNAFLKRLKEHSNAR